MHVPAAPQLSMTASLSLSLPSLPALKSWWRRGGRAGGEGVEEEEREGMGKEDEDEEGMEGEGGLEEGEEGAEEGRRRPARAARGGGRHAYRYAPK